MLGNRNPHICVQQMHEFGIVDLSIKPPQEIEAFKDAAYVQGLLRRSVSLCNVLGLLFTSLKA